MGQLDTIPETTELATTENMDWEFETARRLTTDQTLASAVCSMEDEHGNPVVLADAATVAGTVVTQHVDGSILSPGMTYLMTITFEVAANDVQSAYLRVVCRR